MANPVMSSYAQVGKKEDVSEEIGMISPTNTPVLSSIGSDPVHNTLYQWLEDALDAPAVNAQVEGAAAPTANQVPVVARTNYTQIFAKTVSTTGTSDAVDLHGKPGVEFARQMAKKGKEIKRDVEYALVGTQQTQVAGDASSTARKMDGVQAQIASGVTTDIKVLTAQATNQPLSEAAILATAQLVFAAGGEPDMLVVKPADSVLIAGFAAATGRLRELGNDEKKIVNVVDIYVTPFGSLKVVIDRWIAAADALLLDPGMWKLRTLRNWFTKQLAETGDARQSELLGEFGLSHKNFSASGRIKNLS